MNKDDLIKLALPVSIVISALIIYAGMTKPYRDCVSGYLLVSKSMGTGDGEIQQGIARQQCKK